MQKQHEDLRTSQEWQEHFECLVYDPDGWDRQNYQYSWHEEEISEDEFRNRVSISTMLWRGRLDVEIDREICNAIQNEGGFWNLL